MTVPTATCINEDFGRAESMGLAAYILGLFAGLALMSFSVYYYLYLTTSDNLSSEAKKFIMIIANVFVFVTWLVFFINFGL